MRFIYVLLLYSFCFLRFFILFFFSSRRRPTRYIGDWSSDVCSSDLYSASRATIVSRNRLISDSRATWNSLMNSVQVVCIDQRLTNPSRTLKRRTNAITRSRSEERRVGKEGRSRGWVARWKKRTTTER